MIPTFNDGDSVLIDKRPTNLSQDDIIIFEKDNQSYIKRIKGVPSQKVYYNQISKSFTIDGEVIDNCCEQYPNSIFNKFKEKTVTIPNGYYFVLGDNVNLSIDSRNFGLIKEEEIKGKVVFKFWPLFSKANE